MGGQLERIRILLSVAVVAIIVLAGGFALSGQEPSKRTVWDSVYSQAQAERGRALYKEHCGHCHRDDLTGGGSEAGAPPLRGPMFFHRWLHLPLSEMFLTIGTTMPQNKPDSLTPQIVIDIVSFLMLENQLPAGKTDLPADLAALEHIQVTERERR